MSNRNTSIDRLAFCWRPYWSSRFESLWSLLCKFAHLNAITPTEIRKLFWCDAVSQKLKWRWCFQADLRHFGALDPSKLSIIFGIDDRSLAEATVLQYVQEHEAGILTSEFLRFCPTCIYQGFHSPLHQLLFLNKCPAHGDRLEIRCTECLTHTIPYKLPSVSSKYLSNCVPMMHGLNQHLTYGIVDELQKEAAERGEALLSIANLLMKRVDLNTPEQQIAQWMPGEVGRRCFTRHLRRLPAYWNEVFETNSHKASFNFSKVVDTHIQVSHRESSRTSETCSRFDLEASLSAEAAEAWDLELYRIYKAIGRRLIRSYLLHHRRCIVRVGRYISWNSRVLTWQGAICPAANALLLWRMRWEGIDHPNTLFRSLMSRWARFDYPHPRINWVPPSVVLPDWALRRIFALECVGLFHECLLLAEALYRRNAYSFQLRYVKGRRIPHWLIEEGESGELIIHWWVSRSLSSLFSHSSSHFKSRGAKSCPPTFVPAL